METDKEAGRHSVMWLGEAVAAEPSLGCTFLVPPIGNGYGGF